MRGCLQQCGLCFCVAALPRNAQSTSLETEQRVRQQQGSKCALTALPACSLALRHLTVRVSPSMHKMQWPASTHVQGCLCKLCSNMQI